jgi:hypothetical protein
MNGKRNIAQLFIILLAVTSLLTGSIVKGYVDGNKVVKTELSKKQKGETNDEPVIKALSFEAVVTSPNIDFPKDIYFTPFTFFVNVITEHASTPCRHYLSHYLRILFTHFIVTNAP